MGAASSTSDRGGTEPLLARRRVVYSGRVQRVGFRTRTMHAARRFSVAGWVRNRIDGNVELVVEGPPREIEPFLSEVALRMAANIEKTEVFEEQPSGDLQGFSIKE